MLSTTFSTIVALPAATADELLREYSYRQAIGHHKSPDEAVAWHPSDDVAMSGRVEISSVGANQSRVDLRLDFASNELAVTWRYSRFLDGYRRYVEAGCIAAPQMERQARAA